MFPTRGFLFPEDAGKGWGSVLGANLLDLGLPGQGSPASGEENEYLKTQSEPLGKCDGI